MAGLVRNSGGRSRTRTQLPMFPLPDTTLTPYYTHDQSESGAVHLPGFAGGTAGRSIKLFQNSATAFGATFYNIDGSTVSGGGWATTGITMSIATAAGSSNADRFVGSYMDEADQLWYMLFTDTSTSPNTLYFSKINEAGTVTAIGNAQLGSTSFNNMWYNGTYVGSLRRKGGDGSGDFALIYGYTAGGNASAAVPYRCAEITISASNGSLSYANILPDTSGNYTGFYNLGRIGPTANNIIGGSAYALTGASFPFAYGPIINMTTGRFTSYAAYGNPGDNGFPYNGGGNLMSTRHRKKYVFSGYSSAIYGSSIFDEDEVHAWLDEMAVYYGIL
tara:strand:+ start:36 stop:1034 length:999 start_codon:yes stop_codon:yes gene_type:complete